MSILYVDVSVRLALRCHDKVNNSPEPAGSGAWTLAICTAEQAGAAKVFHNLALLFWLRRKTRTVVKADASPRKPINQ
jgi:hypothetical protein